MKYIRALLVPFLAFLLAYSVIGPAPANAQPATAVASGAVAADTSKLTCDYNVYRGPNCSRRVILSYDDCPSSLESFKKTVRAAMELNIGLSLFPTGECLESGRFKPKYARNRGHHVFNHSVSHEDLRDLSYSGVLKELGAPGYQTTYGRPPYGATNNTVRRAYAAMGMRIWLWNVDTRDWSSNGLSRSAVVSHVIHSTDKGDTVLMHMQWRGFNPKALRQIKEGLKNRGIKLCRSYPGTAPKAPQGNLRC